MSVDNYAPATSVEFLNACIDVQAERGKQYNAEGAGERSFAAAASAFNSVTGKSMKGSDVCLMLVMLKLTRQYSSPERLHADSVLDAVSYAALWAEELVKELKRAEHELTPKRASNAEMSMDILAKMTMTEAMQITGTDGKDAHTQDIAFKLACFAMAEEKAS